MREFRLSYVVTDLGYVGTFALSHLLLLSLTTSNTNFVRIIWARSLLFLLWLFISWKMVFRNFACLICANGG
jgi:hypothetical protein